VATPTPLPTATPLPATCYESPELNGVRSDLVWRIAMLEEMVKKGDIKSETANEARTALERELSFFEAVAALQSLEVKEHIKSEDQLVVLMQDGNLKIRRRRLKRLIFWWICFWGKINVVTVRPHLKTLIFEVTQRCNHACLHCYNFWQAGR